MSGAVDDLVGKQLEVESLDSRELLLQIARCPNVDRCLSSGDGTHPCMTIVNHQRELGIEEPYVPVPWIGHIEMAPILFLSSNPSITGVEFAPKASWPDDEIIDFHANGFDENRDRPWIIDGVRNLQKDGTYRKHAVRFWAAVRGRAAELLCVPKQRVRPGVDYALSEVVHCCSQQEAGVWDALGECADRYLEPLFDVAGARVVVCLGAHCERMVRERLKLANGSLAGPLELGGHKRYLAFLPHPNAFKPKTFAKCLTEPELSALRQAVSA